MDNDDKFYERLNNPDYDDEYEYVDNETVIEALRAAWDCVPDMSLSELLDTATPAPFCELSNKELLDSLNEFILQNQ